MAILKISFVDPPIPESILNEHPPPGTKMPLTLLATSL